MPDGTASPHTVAAADAGAAAPAPASKGLGLLLFITPRTPLITPRTPHTASPSPAPRRGHPGPPGSGPVQAPVLSPYPPATQDVALIVDAAVPAAEVQAALRDGAATAGEGILLEDIRLFDVYTGAQVGEGRKSLAYTLGFRALDRTLTAAEATAARDAAVAEAEERVGATLRGG